MDSNREIKKILLVDDTPVARKMIKSCIARAEIYEFYEADDGVAGLESYKRNRPDVTFMDINMPKMTGMECLAQIRSTDPDALVILCSSEINPESAKKAMALGAFSVVKKPPTKEAITQVLSRAQAVIQ